MSNFQDLINKLAFQDGLPFSVDFKDKPDWSKVPHLTVDILGYQFPQFNDLLPIEDWFFTYLSNKRQEKIKDISIQSQLLLFKAKDLFGIEDLDLAGNLLFEYALENEPKSWAKQKETILQSKEYIDFLETNSQLISDLTVELTNLADNNKDKWLRITLFLNTRLGAGWEVGHVAMLPGNLDLIDTFILQESNKGITVEDIPEDIKGDESTEEKDQGKKQ